MKLKNKNDDNVYTSDGFLSRRLNNLNPSIQVELNTRKKVPWRFILILSSITPIVVYFIPIDINATPSVGINQTGNSTNQLGQAASNDTIGWQTFQDNQFGFKLQAPPDWREAEIPNPDTNMEKLAITPEDVSTLISPMFAKTKVIVEVENSSSGRTLDPTTLEVKSLPVESVETHANKFIEAARSGVIEGLSIDVLKNEATTFGGEPAWNVQYITNSEGYQREYGSKFLVIKGDKVFDVTFSTEPLKVPEMRPIGEKILQSFQFTTPQPNAPEPTTPEPEQPDSGFPTSPSISENGEGNEDEGDQSTDEEDSDSDEDEENQPGLFG
jgi:PsbP